MLLRFGVSNHLSIRDHQELSLSASSLRDREDGLIDCPATSSGSLLPEAVIYGANASGKSNLIDAINTMRNMVMSSQTGWEPDGGVPRQPFRLNEESGRSPSRFEIDFLLDGARHHYGFEASDAAFESEWLYAFPKSRRQMLFEREGDEFHFGRALKGQNSVIARLTRPNSLFLSSAAQNGHQQLSKVSLYFLMFRVVPSGDISDRMVSNLLMIPNLLGRTKELDRRVISFLGEIDTGVIDYRRKESGPLEEYRELATTILKEAGFEPLEDKRVAIELAHRGRDGEPFYLEMERESAGTRRLLFALDFAFNALDKGAPLFIDELGASLHTQAAETLLKLFQSKETNPKGAQIIATTHDTNLLAPSVLRRDEVWFTRKEADGATRLYPLTDIRTRRGDNIERGYLQGRYGATPFDDPVSALGAPN